ncbi:hypothetical protein [Clostridium paraputrificum]|uniref:hypothetical protein n=1 Tax=Clostridium paraputrificum TaxID=29363 RepID=UPI0011C7A839|nr:hypothetical protein [Clostridium paraputrificum]
MSNYFDTYVEQVRGVKRNEGNQLLKYIIKFTDTSHKWEGSLRDFIYLLSKFRERTGDECNVLESYKKEHIFERELMKIRTNLSIRGIKVFTKRTYETVSIVVSKNDGNDFSRYYFCEEYMMQFF